MQNFLAAFLFMIINFFTQAALHFFPYIRDTTQNIRNILHVMRLLLFNTSISVVAYDVFKGVGPVNYFLYLFAIFTIVITSQDIVRPNYMIILVLWLAIMIAVAYFLCYFRDDLNIEQCLVCDYNQASDQGQTSNRSYVRGFY